MVFLQIPHNTVILSRLPRHLISVADKSVCSIIFAGGAQGP